MPQGSQHTTPPVGRLGLLGGSFNPIHNCHLTIAHQVSKHLQLSRVLFIPSGDPPHKRNGSLAPAHIRLEMVRLAIADTPMFEVSDIEIQRSGKSYTIDTVCELQHQYGASEELFFIIGLDAFLDFPTWKRPTELLARCHFVVVPRPTRAFQDLAQMPLLPNLDTQTLTQLDSGALTQLEITLPACPGITCLSLPPCPTSASDIRQRIRGGATLANMLPPPVRSYILQHSLYQED